MSRFILFFILLVGCVKHVQIEAQNPPHPAYKLSADRTWAYYAENRGEWVVMSRVGPEKATKFLCPKGAICTTEMVGTMYRIRRAK